MKRRAFLLNSTLAAAAVGCTSADPLDGGRDDAGGASDGGTAGIDAGAGMDAGSRDAGSMAPDGGAADAGMPVAGRIGQAQVPDLTGLNRFTDAEYTVIRAMNEVVIDPSGGGDYVSWEAWQSAGPASYVRPVCVTFRKGVLHTLPSGAAAGRIFPGDVPGVGRVILSTDGTLPAQSAYSPGLNVVPSATNRIYPSDRGELAWFETPASGNHTIFGIRDNDVDIWFRGLHHQQNETVPNSRGFWNMSTPATSAQFCERIQWDRCVFRGQDMYNNRENRKAGYIAGRYIGFFDCYIHQLNAAQNPVVAAALFPTSGGPFVVWNSHLEAMGHCVYIDAQLSLPAADMLPRDGAIAYCHLYKPHSWHTAGFPDYRPKTFFEVSSGERIMLYRCLMENGLASIDGQPGINLKNKYPGHPLGAGHKSEDIIVSECWMRRVKEPFSLLGTANIRRLTVKDVVCEQLGNRAGYGNGNYFCFDVVRSVTGGAASPAQVHIEGLTLADIDNTWTYHYSGSGIEVNDGVMRNSVLPNTQYGPYSTTQGGDGAIGDRIGMSHDGRGCVIVGKNPAHYDAVPGMFASCTFPPDDSGLFRGGVADGDWRLNPAHPSATTGVDGYADPGGADAVIAAIGIRGALVRSTEVTV